jgi:hypothetical protein
MRSPRGHGTANNVRSRVLRDWLPRYQHGRLERSNSGVDELGRSRDDCRIGLKPILYIGHESGSLSGTI